MMLRDLILSLRAQPADKRLKLGFANPHSYRGYYNELAFEPKKDVTVGEMLAAATSALGATYGGYKGGQYTMNECTDCWLAEYGDCGEALGLILLGYMLRDESTVK
jgi:hypothetical protein